MTSNQPWWLTWPPAEVAATILPLFSYSAHRPYRDAMNSAVNWCRTGSNSTKGHLGKSGLSAPFEDPDFRAIAEAMQVLEHAGLLMRTFASESSAIGLTRLGRDALVTDTVRQHLGLGDAPPRA
jgi:hypothetical protein